jgi:hypothetical protein
VSVLLGRAKKARRVRQLVTLNNIGGAAITGPLRFVLVGLSRKIKVVGAAGVSAGSPFVLVDTAGGFVPGAQLTFTVLLKNPGLRKVVYAPQVLT